MVKGVENKYIIALSFFEIEPLIDRERTHVVLELDKLLSVLLLLVNIYD